MTTGASDYVGSTDCKSCHAAEAAAWERSDHFRAMLPATAATVAGDFSDVRVTFHGMDTRFFKDGDDHFVETVGRAGKRGTYPVRYTFGYRPLQQYLLDPRGRRPSGVRRRLGHAPGPRRSTLVPPADRRTDGPGTPLLLDGTRDELVESLRGLPFDKCRQESRRRDRQVPDRLRRGQRGLRSLPWPGGRACRAWRRRGH